MKSHAAVKWCEDPPKWDVVSVREIRRDDSSVSELHVDETVEVRYGKNWFPAIIVALGTEEDMEREVDLIESQLDSADEDGGTTNDMGRGKRKKKRKQLISSDEESVDHVDMPPIPKAKSKKDIRKRQDENQSRNVLSQLCNKACVSCSQKEKEIEGLRCKLAETTRLLDQAKAKEDAQQDLQGISDDLRSATNRLLSAIATLERGLPPAVNRTPTSRPSSSLESGVPPVLTRTPASRQASSGFESATPVTSRTAAVSRPPTAIESEGSEREGERQSNDEMVLIGTSGVTRLATSTYNRINWFGERKKAARDLLVAVFGRATLAASSLTGGATHNPALASGPPKAALDPVTLADVIDFMTKKLKLTASEARTIIRSKLNDEAKLRRMRAHGRSE